MVPCARVNISKAVSRTSSAKPAPRSRTSNVHGSPSPAGPMAVTSAVLPYLMALSTTRPSARASSIAVGVEGRPGGRLEQHLLGLGGGVPDLVEDAGDRHERRLRREDPGVEPAEDQQLLDQPRQPRRRQVRPLEHVVALLRAERVLVGEHRVEEALDDRDRGAQLVRHAGDEVGLEPLELHHLLEQAAALEGAGDLAGRRCRAAPGRPRRSARPAGGSAASWPMGRSAPTRATRWPSGLTVVCWSG